MNENFMSSHQNDFDFQAFKAKIQDGRHFGNDYGPGGFQGGGSGDDGNQLDPYFKPTSEGRKKRSNSDPMICESFFNATYCGEVEDVTKRTRRTKEVEESTRRAPFKRSQSTDAITGGLFSALGGDEFKLEFTSQSESDQNSGFAFEDPEDGAGNEFSFESKPKRRQSEPMMNTDFFNDDYFDFQGFGKGQDSGAFEFKKGSKKETKKAGRQRANSEPMFNDDDLENIFGEAGEKGKCPPPAINLFDTIQDVLGMDDSERTFDSDEEQLEKPKAKEESSRDQGGRNIRRPGSAPVLPEEFFDTVFDEKAQAAEKERQEQDDVDQDELDLFIQKMFTREKGGQPNDQQRQAANMGDHQRSKSCDAVATLPSAAQMFANDFKGYPQFSLPGMNANGGFSGMNANMGHSGMNTGHQGMNVGNLPGGPPQDESLHLYNMLFSGENMPVNNQHAGGPSFDSMGMPQAMDNINGQFNQNPNQTSGNTPNDATVFVLNAVKATQNQLHTLHPLVLKSGDTTAMEEIAHAFKITASASQYVLSSDLPNAVAVLSKAQSTIEVLWNRLSGKMGNKDSMVPTHTVVSADGMKLVNFESKRRNSSNDSVCSSITGMTGGNSRSASPAVIRPPEMMFDAHSVASGKSGKSTKSGRSRNSRRAIFERELPPQDPNNPIAIMERLKSLMERTQYSQNKLQQWDKKNGLPKSHSQTMVNSSRSRKQLQEGVVLKKWNGAPLIGKDGKVIREGHETS